MEMLVYRIDRTIIIVISLWDDRYSTYYPLPYAIYNRRR